MNENIQMIIAIWGAVLSTILAVLSFIKYKKDYTSKIQIIAKSEEAFEYLEFNICNKSKTPITLIKYGIGIGSDKKSQSMIISKKIKKPIKLNESDIYSEKINRDLIITNVFDKKIKSKEFQRIWINVQLSSGKEIHETVYINPAIIEKDYYDKAEQFIATDIFIGFNQKNSKTFPIGIHK